MLDLDNLDITGLQEKMVGLRKLYAGDHKTLRDVTIPIPKGNHLSPAQLQQLADSAALAREFSDTASRIEGRWFQAFKEFETLLKRKQNKLLEFEWEDRITYAELLKQGAKDDRKILLQTFRKVEWAEYLEIETFMEELQGYYTAVKARHVAIRRAQDDINTYTSIIRTAMFDKQYFPDSPDNVKRNHDGLNRSHGYDLLHNKSGPDPMGHPREPLTVGQQSFETNPTEVVEF